MITSPIITEDRLVEILHGITELKAGVIGDISLDMYWEADMQYSELSRETPHYTLPIRKESYYPGAAGNVAHNLRKLGCQNVFICSIIGDDWRGKQLMHALQMLDVDVSHMIAHKDWTTPGYCKPIRIGLQNVRQEDARLDFNNYHKPSDVLINEYIARIDAMAEQVDIIAVTDQLKFGVVCDAVRACLRKWMERGKVIVIDSRERIHLFSDMILKPNEIELLNYFGIDHKEQSAYTLPQWLDLARKMANDLKSTCVVTLGEQGSVWADGDQVTWAPSLSASPPIDIVGAGDSFASALLASLGSGAKSDEAMTIAHHASAVSIKTIGSTGTATAAEIIDMFRQHNKN